MQDLPLQNYPAPGQPIDELALAEIKGAILAKLRLAIGKDAGMATQRDWYKAAALALRDRIVHRWLMAEKQTYDAGSKRVYYLSLDAAKSADDTRLTGNRSVHGLDPGSSQSDTAKSKTEPVKEAKAEVGLEGSWSGGGEVAFAATGSTPTT